MIVNNSAEFSSVTRTTEDFFRVMAVQPERGRLADLATSIGYLDPPNLAVVSR